MLKFADNIVRKLPTRPRVWISLWVIWFVTLWILSSGNPAPKDGPDIPHLDKVVHFGYFGIGASFFIAWLYYTSNEALRSKKWRAVIITTIAGSIVGAIDEFHQSFTPGRMGNDIGDWTADTLGSLTAAIICYHLLNRRERLTRST